MAEFKSRLNNLSLKEILEPADVLLIVSPLVCTRIPVMGIHLLQAGCRGAGIDAKVLYSNLFYTNLIGADLHKSISGDYHFLLGERIFAPAAFNLHTASMRRMVHQLQDPAWIPDHIWRVNPGGKDSQIPGPFVYYRKWLSTVNLEYMVPLTVNWLNQLAREIVNIGFPIVGCSTTFGGLAPALALLNCVKKADSRVVTILGGTLCEAEMAGGILSLNTDIDYIFSGEGEITFPGLVNQILAGGLPKEKIIYGQDVMDLDALPLPVYQDYAQQNEKLNDQWSPFNNMYWLPFETSRGCWYGKCTFCVLGGKKNLFRCKSTEVIIQSLKTLVKQHNINVVEMTDNMMPLQYFDTLIPRFSIEIPAVSNIIYEMRADLTLDQVISLKKAGIIFRPGIESLSPSLLKRMKKPYTLRGNIALLRYARSVDIYLDWALLFGFPGDQVSEYEEMLHLLPLIPHLQPPRVMEPLVLYRFSKYHNAPDRFGISNLQPAEVYKTILPPHAEPDKIAYYFTAEFPAQSRENPEIITRLWEEYQAWRSAWASYEAIPLDIFLPSLHVSRKATGRYVLEDTRGLSGQPKRMEIDGKQANLLLVARPLEAVPGPHVQWALDARLAVTMESWFIPLATAEPGLLSEFEREYRRGMLWK